MGDWYHWQAAKVLGMFMRMTSVGVEVGPDDPETAQFLTLISLFQILFSSMEWAILSAQRLLMEPQSIVV